MSRLDYLFISNHLSDITSEVKIRQNPHLDHALISLALGTLQKNRGPGLWRFDASLLTDQAFNTQMSEFLAAWEPPPELVDPTVIWEWLKFKIKGFIIEFQGKKKSTTTLFIRNLQSQIEDLSQKMSADSEERETIACHLESVRRELREIEEEKANKAILRSRCKWAKLGEKLNRYFLNLEKMKSRDNALSGILSEAGTIISDRKEILEQCRLFYSRLYSERSEDLIPINEIERALSNMDGPTLSEISQEQLELPITTEELRTALTKMNKGKAPGSDGLPPEFYLAHWNVLSPHLLNSISASVLRGSLSMGQKKGIISLIPKKDLDRRRVENWCPITLLNCDYKILTKAIALRLQRHIPPLIHPDQSGFVQRRYIGENIRTIENAVDIIHTQAPDGMIIALDFTKAFDSVRWDLIYAALKYFNFGEEFINLIRLLFSGIESSVFNAGSTSTFFCPKRGIRQGCSASPYLFNLVVELLAIKIRGNPNIKGLKMRSAELKASQFADDLTCFLKDRDSLQPLMEVLEEFGKRSGLKINLSKSKLLYPMGAREEVESIAGIPVCSEAKILGIWFSTSMDSEKNYNKNFKGILTKAKQICSSWSHRSLSIKGKVTVANSLITSLFQYPCASIHTPPEVFSELKRIFSNFLWNNKKPKIAYSTLILPVAQGGLNLFDLESRTQAAHIQAIRRILLYPEHGPALYLQHILKADSLLEVLRSRPKSIPKSISRLPYYNAVFKIWFRAHHLYPTDEISIRREALWNNKWITTPSGPLHNQLWARKGIGVIQDICHPLEDGLLSHTELAETYNVRCTFLEMLAVRLSIPLQWRQTLSAGWTPPPVFPGGPTIVLHDQELHDVNNISAKRMYNSLIASGKLTNTAFHRWRNNPTDISVSGEEEWERVCLRVYKTVKENLKSLPRVRNTFDNSG